MEKEKCKIKGNVKIEIKTNLEPNPIQPVRIPSPKVFEVKKYYDRKWVMIFLTTDIWNEIVQLCEKKNLNPEEVMYGTILKLVRKLRE